MTIRPDTHRNWSSRALMRHAKTLLILIGEVPGPGRLPC